MFYRFKKNLSRTLKCSAFFVWVGLVCAEPVFCQTIHNYGQWRNISTLYKSAYISGVIDERLTKRCKNCQKKVKAENLKMCLSELNITIAEIVTMVDSFYLNRDNWELKPQHALDHQLIRGHCFTYIED